MEFYEINELVNEIKRNIATYLEYASTDDLDIIVADVVESL